MQKAIGSAIHEFNFDGLSERVQPLLDALEPIKPAFDNLVEAVRDTLSNIGLFVGEQITKIGEWAVRNSGTDQQFYGCGCGYRGRCFCGR